MSRKQEKLLGVKRMREGQLFWRVYHKPSGATICSWLHHGRADRLRRRIAKAAGLNLEFQAVGEFFSTNAQETCDKMLKLCAKAQGKN